MGKSGIRIKAIDKRSIENDIWNKVNTLPEKIIKENWFIVGDL